MQYNPYLPTAYPQLQMNYQNNPIVWVQGLEGAKAYPVGAGNHVLLMDSEESVFYIKSSDQNGMPMPLRVFDYKERIETKPEADFVTRKEFEEAMKRLTPKKREEKKDE